jgi:formate dehydrogenase major subunit
MPATGDAVNLDACIHCNLCVRACREVQVNDVIGMAGAGRTRRDRLRFRRPHGREHLRGLRRMRAGLPDRALQPVPHSGRNGRRERQVYGKKKPSTVCPFCGVGCQISFTSRMDKILYVDGAPGPANENRLCVKGRFGFDYSPTRTG